MIRNSDNDIIIELQRRIKIVETAYNMAIDVIVPGMNCCIPGACPLSGGCLECVKNYFLKVAEDEFCAE